MSSTPPERGVETAHSADASARRAPRYPNFLLVGAALGLIAAMILTFAFQQDPAEIDVSNGDVYYSPGQVFGFLLLFCVPIGLGLLGLTAWLIDRATQKRAHLVRMDRVDVHASEEPVEPPAPSPSAEQEDKP